MTVADPTEGAPGRLIAMRSTVERIANRRAGVDE